MVAEETGNVPTPADLLEEMLAGFQSTQALHVAARLAIFDLLHNGPKSSRELAGTIGAHEPSLRRLLGFLTTVGVLSQDDHGSFCNTALGDLLRSDIPESEHPWAMLLGSPIIWRPWGDLYQSVMTGRPSFDPIFGRPFFDHLANNPEDAALFNAAMTSSSSPAAILDAYDFSNFRKIVDVGGGQGALLQGILEQYTETRGVLYDLPSVVADARDLRESPVAARCEVIGGDMFQSVPEGGDAYILRRIVHDWSDAESVLILRNCARAMSDEGKILLVEQIKEPTKSSDPATSADLMMLVLVSGRERTEEEFRALFRQAGLDLSRVTPAGGRHILEAVRI